MFVCLCLCVCMVVVCMFGCMFVCLYVCMFVCLFVVCLSVCMSVCLSVCSLSRSSRGSAAETAEAAAAVKFNPNLAFQTYLQRVEEKPKMKQHTYKCYRHLTAIPGDAEDWRGFSVKV